MRRGVRQLSALCLLAAPVLLQADTLVLMGGTAVEGAFQGLRGDRLYFAPASGGKLQEPLLRVETLRVEPPARVAVRPRSGRRLEGVLLRGYAQNTFTFEQNGKPLALKALTIGQIEPELDFAREMALQRAARTPTADAGTDAPEIAALLKTGAVSVVQFHMESNIASTRQGSYVRGLAEKSHGKIHLAVISVPDFDAPAARKHQIETVPQFWVHSRSGRLVKKLSGQFPEKEIDQALRAAGRAP
jgi:hypothetical protein